MSTVRNPIYSLFLKLAAESPNKIAIDFGNERLTFKQLKELCEVYAKWLVNITNPDRNVQKLVGERIVLHLHKKPITYALWLACIRQGIVYSFADPTAPEKRTQSIIDRLKPILVVTDGDLVNPYGVSSQSSHLTNITRQFKDDELPDIGEVYALDPLYVMFTSGSTGVPKGVVISNMGIVNLIHWSKDSVIPMIGNANTNRQIVFSNINPLHFDNSVFDLFCGLMNGNTIVPIETMEVTIPGHWVKVLRDSGAHVIFSVPTLFQTFEKLNLLQPEHLPSIKLFVFGGEGYPTQALNKFYAKFRKQSRFLNVYGPTETSCICSSIEINDLSLQNAMGMTFPSVGKMHDGYKKKIIDSEGKLAGKNEVGELWIGGDNVGLGYFNELGKSDVVFTQNPNHRLFRDVWYKTGDLVSVDENDHIWFAGRADNQIKVRGYRIELEEIDAAIERFPEIERANSVKSDINGTGSIVVVFTAKQKVDVRKLSEHCRNELPTYMIPQRLIQMDELPKNANGKIDRKSIQQQIET